MKRGKQILFIETKARKYDPYKEIVSITQKQKITKAVLFLAKCPKYILYKAKFDLALVIPYNMSKIIRNTL